VTAGAGRPVVIDLSTSNGEDVGINRSVKRRQSSDCCQPVKAASVSTDDEGGTSESSLLLSEQDDGRVETDILSNSELSKPRMPRPTSDGPEKSGQLPVLNVHIVKTDTSRASNGTETYKELGSPYTHRTPCTFGGRACGDAE
jgi:hypothetical protein